MTTEEQLTYENGKLKEHLELLRSRLKDRIEVCLWIHEDPTLGLTVGDDVVLNGVPALKAQRDTLRLQNNDLRALSTEIAAMLKKYQGRYHDAAHAMKDWAKAADLLKRYHTYVTTNPSP